MSTSEGYLSTLGGGSVHRRDIMIYVGDVMSTSGGNHDSCGGAN